MLCELIFREFIRPEIRPLESGRRRLAAVHFLTDGMAGRQTYIISGNGVGSFPKPYKLNEREELQQWLKTQKI